MPDSGRYDISLAPGGLALVHSFLNTAAAGRPRESDLLESVTAAQRWLDDAAAAAERPALDVTAADLPHLRELRDALRAVMTQRDDATQLLATAELGVSASGTPTALPSGHTAAEWLRSAILGECFVAAVTGTWPRLKLCANPRCGVAFYDRSRNRSGVWHDVHTCGNTINLRASRARRRKAKPAG
jgi:predicted RNA-binding Zn ribbon-like protein